MLGEVNGTSKSFKAHTQIDKLENQSIGCRVDQLPFDVLDIRSEAGLLELVDVANGRRLPGGGRLHRNFPDSSGLGMSPNWRSWKVVKSSLHFYRLHSYQPNLTYYLLLSSVSQPGPTPKSQIGDFRYNTGSFGHIRSTALSVRLGQSLL